MIDLFPAVTRLAISYLSHMERKVRFELTPKGSHSFAGRGLKPLGYFRIKYVELVDNSNATGRLLRVAELPVRIELTTEDYKSTVLPLNYRSINVACLF